LSYIKKGVVFINTSRGEIIDEKVLIKLLKRKHIKMAGLDVYSNEPYIRKEFFKLDNVVMLPHIGSAVYNVRQAMVRQAVENLILFFTSQVSK